MTQQNETFAALRAANRLRQNYWPGYTAADLPFRVIEFGGEAGELQDAFKKLLRLDRSIGGNTGQDREALLMAIREEVGDVLISMDMMLDEAGISIADCVPMKFNKTSNKVGIPVLMDEETWEAHVVQ